MNTRILQEGSMEKEDSITARILTFAYNHDEIRAINLIEQEIVSNSGFDLLQVRDTRGYTCNN